MNTVTEEVIVGILNEAKARGIETTDPRYPVVQLEKPREPEKVAGIAKGKPVHLVGNVVLRVQMKPQDKNDEPETLMRFKIFQKGGFSPTH